MRNLCKVVLLLGVYCGTCAPLVASASAAGAKLSVDAAERDWARVEFHLKRCETDSAGVYCKFIIRDNGTSPRAKDAAQLLERLSTPR